MNLPIIRKGSKIINIKPKITKERFNKAIEAVKAGSYPMSELIEKFDLDTEQMKVIKKA